MKEEIEKAIKKLIGMIDSNVIDSNNALKITQAALNLAHTSQIIKQTEITK